MPLVIGREEGGEEDLYRTWVQKGISIVWFLRESCIPF